MQNDRDSPHIQTTVTQIQISKKIQQKFKQAISVVGNQGRYQFLTIIIFCLLYFFIQYFVVNTSFYYMNPIFDCDGLRTDEDQACKKLDQCILVNDYTVTGDNKLYCDRKDDRYAIQMMYDAGAILGVLFVNIVSDYKGRKFSLKIGIVCQILSTSLLLIGSSTDLLALFYISQLLGGFGANSAVLICFVYIDKLLSNTWTTRTMFLMNGIGCTCLLTYIFFENYSNWNIMALYVMLIPTVITFIACLFFVIEDPIFLYTKNQIEASKAGLTKIARFNKTMDKLPQAFKIVEQMQRQNLKLTHDKASLKLLLDRHVLLPIILLGIYQFGINFAYHAINYAISQIGYSYGLTMLVFGLAQSLGSFPLIKVAPILPRKLTTIIKVAVTIAIQLLFFIQLGSLTQTLLLGSTRFIFGSQYIIYVYLLVESFPQHIQSTSSGVVETIGQTSKLVSPLSITLAKQINMNPVGMVGIISVVIVFLPLFGLKETVGKRKNEQKSQKKSRQDGTESVITSNEESLLQN